jgi:hypothetical protein
MERFNKLAIKIIAEKLTEKFNRQLTFKEMRSFWLIRSAKAYEAIIDYITDTNNSIKDIELYIQHMLMQYVYII